MRRSGIRAWTLALVSLAILWGISRGHVRRLAQEGIHPYEKALRWFGRTLSVPGQWLVQAHTGVQRLGRLEAENAELRLAVSRLESVKLENKTLRHLLEVSDTVQGRFVVCTVLSRGGAAGWWERLRLSAGERDGIRSGQPVLGPAGIVGRIVSVSAGSSEVLLITDPNSRVACVLDPGLPGWRGVLVGAGSASRGKQLELLYSLDPLLLRFLDRDIEIPERARVLTSGKGGVFPAGYLLGHVVASRQEPGGLYQVAEVKPAVDPWSLTHVLVMIGEEQP